MYKGVKGCIQGNTGWFIAMLDALRSDEAAPNDGTNEDQEYCIVGPIHGAISSSSKITQFILCMIRYNLTTYIFHLLPVNPTV